MINPDIIGNGLFWIAGFAVIIAIYLGMGGRALFGTHERPEHLLGKIVEFMNAEGLEQSICPPQGRVESFKDSAYKIAFESDFTYGEKIEHYVTVFPHSKGWPVSGALKRPTAVLATLGSGHRFWADIKVVEKENTPNQSS